MPTQVQFRRGTATQNDTFTGAAGELSINSDNNALRIHDGSTAGGHELAKADLSNVSGIGSVTIQNLNVTGLSTFVGVSTHQATLFGKQLNISGITTASSFVKHGGTSSQFLKADGSVDSNVYLTSYTETDTLNSVILRSNSTSNGISIGVLTATSASFSGNVTIAGTLTYEDVVNVDSIGIATARSGLRITGGGLDVVGVSTFNSNVNVNGNIDINGATELDNINVSGLSTFVGIVTSQNNLFVGNGLSVAGDARIVGVLTVGSSSVTINGSNNTINVGSGVTINPVTSSFNQLEVVGVSTFSGIATFVNNVYAQTLTLKSLNIDGGGSLGADIVTRNISASGLSTFIGSLNVGAAGTVVTTTTEGKVGINSMTPEYKLDVGGVINSSTDVKIDGISVLTTASNDALALAIALG